MAKSIITIFDPSVQLDILDIKDVEYGTDSTYKPHGQEVRYSKLVGDYSPFIQINGMRFSGADIEYFEIDTSGFLPVVSFAIREKGGLFTSKSFPRDGDLINVLIKSNNKDFKPVRNDYRVMNVSASPSMDEMGQINTFSISGILNLPELYVDNARSYPNKTSSDVLQAIARELKLGFATNETSYNDIMTRICPYAPYRDFILNDVLPGSYKDDSSFFDAYIDHMYYLNMVNINDMLTHDKELDSQTINFLSSSDYHPDDVNEPASELVEMYLTNSTFMAGTPNQIVGYAPVNNSGNVSMTNGYRTYIQYFNKDKDDYEQYFIETLVTDGSDKKIILKGREDFDHTKQLKTLNVGYQFDDNVHKNFHHAKVNNKYNQEELKKLMLSVDLAGINPNLYKGQVIPVYIVNNRGNDIRNEATKDDDEPNSLSVDSFLSGYYMIKGMKFIYDGTLRRYFMNLLLTKREYDQPK